VPDETLEKAQRLARWSLLMLVMLIPAALIAAIFGVYMLGRRDLEGSEPMSVQGAYGWMVWAISTIILLAPVAVGLVLGLKARRLGAKRLGLVGSLIDGAILIGYPIMSVMGLLRQGSG
jgi:cytochrome c oxidase subunit IV